MRKNTKSLMGLCKQNLICIETKSETIEKENKNIELQWRA
uniref:Uncharacterized protein n=1 Tax=Rhizophora mucronata TaxID=61149 RepID=A0A2P2IZ02_RHIMU